MKILQVTNKIPYPPKDGGAIATLNMAIGFSNHGHEVTIASLNTKKHYFNLNNIPGNIASKIKFLATGINTDIKPIDALKNLLFSKKPYNAIRFISSEFENLIISLLKKENFDIVQLEGLYLTPYIPAIREHSNALIAFRAHNVEHEIWLRAVKQENNYLKRFYIKTLANRIKKMEQDIMNNYDLLIPITEKDARKFQKMGNTKPVHVSPTGFDLDKLPKKSTIEPEFPTLFHIGALDWAPNQEGILWFLKNCWPPIIKEVPNAKLYIAGRNAPKWFINKLNFSGVIFLGEIEDAYEFMFSKAIMIVPLLSGSGMRVKIIEGMALGKCIISTSIGAEGINCTHNINILIADDAEPFYKHLKEIVQNKKKYESIRDNAQKFIVNEYDNQVIVRELIDFYKNKINIH